MEKLLKNAWSWHAKYVYVCDYGNFENSIRKFFSNFVKVSA